MSMIIDTIEKKDKNLKDVEWCEYQFNRLFEKINVNNLKYKVKELPDKPNSEYSLPALTAGIQNQGLNCYVPREEATILKNVITISANGANSGATFYQTQEFTVLQDAHAFKWIYNNKQLSDNQYLFIVSVINKTIRDKYTWKDKSCLKRIMSDKIRLPIKNNEIDFEFMESYMKQMLEEAEKRLEKLKQSKYTKHLIDVNNWKKFRVGDLFESSLSKDDIQSTNITDGDYPLISAGKTNNGVKAYIQDDNATLQKANTITVDMFGKVFYQKKPYYCVSHGRVNILTPKFHMNEKQGLFLANIIEIVSRKYEYNEMCTGTKLCEDIIKLPVTSDGKPDWKYMENYMQKIYNDATKTFKMLYPNIK